MMFHTDMFVYIKAPRFAWGFGSHEWRFFVVSVSWETKHKKSSKISGKIREKIQAEISKNSGNFRSATFLT